MIEVAIEESLHVFRMRLDAVRLKNAMGDPDIRLPCDLDILERLLPPEPVAQRQRERLLPGPAGVKDRLIDIEEDKLGLQEFSIFDFRFSINRLYREAFMGNSRRSMG